MSDDRDWLEVTCVCGDMFRVRTPPQGWQWGADDVVRGKITCACRRVFSAVSTQTGWTISPQTSVAGLRYVGAAEVTLRGA